MNQPYNFDKKEPPRITEKMLREELKLRTLRRQMLLLRLAGLLSCLCLAVFAFFIMRDSLAASIISVALLAYTLIGGGIITIAFHKKGMRCQ